MRQTLGRPALGVGRAIGEFAQKRLPIPEEAIAKLGRSESEFFADMLVDLNATPEDWADFVEKEGQVKADLLISRRRLASMGSAS